MGGMAHKEPKTTSPFSSELEARSKSFVDEMLAPGGIEGWVQNGRAPWMYKAWSESGEFFIINIRPDEATRKSWLEMEEGGVVCYLDKNDTVGQTCRSVVATIEQGEVIAQRMMQEAKRLRLENMPPIQRRLTIISQALLTKLKG